MSTSLTRVVGFHAVHRLFRPDWTERQNREAFGPLSDPSGHAHDYRCAVTVRGPIHESRGMVLDLTLLDRILQDEVVAAFEGTDLNQDVPAFTDGRMLPTCEAIATYVYPRISARLPAGVELERVRIMEDSTLYADCTGLP
jgi:6-pyruvoyltetrahydropterin/6-carboxytetrahydropterin synthase